MIGSYWLHERSVLQELALLYGVQPAYYDMYGHHVEASPESRLAAASALAGPFEGMDDVAEALAARRDELESRLIEPVLVAWDGRLSEIELRCPEAPGMGGGGSIGSGGPRGDGGALVCHLDLENGERRAWTYDL